MSGSGGWRFGGRIHRNEMPQCPDRSCGKLSTPVGPRVESWARIACCQILCCGPAEPIQVTAANIRTVLCFLENQSLAKCRNSFNSEDHDV